MPSRRGRWIVPEIAPARVRSVCIGQSDSFVRKRMLGRFGGKQQVIVVVADSLAEWVLAGEDMQQLGQPPREVLCGPDSENAVSE